MSQVFFFKYVSVASPLSGLRQIFTRAGFLDSIPQGSKTAIKLHMGERGNVRYLRPSLVRQVVDIVKRQGGKPFICDTIAAYPGGRENKEKYQQTAAMNGFSESTVNAPVIIMDDNDKLKTVPIKNPIAGGTIANARIPSLLLETDLWIVLSHVKGHELTGFGGAVKNLGMGCVSRHTKQAQHRVNMPVLSNSQECDGCGKCVKSCPVNALQVVENKVQKIMAGCTSCGTCYFNCPANCWDWPSGAKEKLQVNLAHAAQAVFSSYQGSVIFVNFIQDVVPQCDCETSTELPVVQDVGITLSRDPVAIDKVSLDLINQSPVMPGYEHLSPTTDILGKMHETSSLVQLETAEKLKMGSLSYELIPL